MPRVRLTAQSVESLPAVDGRRTDYSDALCPGLVLRVSPTARTWACVWWSSGKLRRVTIGKIGRYTLAQAREEARRILQAGPPTPRGLTVARMLEQAIAQLSLADSTRREWQRVSDHDLIPALGERPAAEVERGEIRAVLREIGRRAPTASNRALTVIRRAYTWAVAEELVRVSPCLGLSRLYHEQPRDRILSPDELRRLIAACARLRLRDVPHPETGEPDPTGWSYADATLLLLLCGVREAAVLGMRAGELEGLDGREPLWTVPASRAKRRVHGPQAGRPHHVPLSPWAVKVVRRRLAAVCPLDTDLLFPSAAAPGRPAAWSSHWTSELRDDMRPVAEDGGPGPLDPPWTIHGLRTALGTHLVEQGLASPTVADLILGHALPGSKVARIYVRAELLPERRAALERWAAWLERLAEPTAGAKVLSWDRPHGVSFGSVAGPDRSGA
jgi:integrase